MVRGALPQPAGVQPGDVEQRGDVVPPPPPPVGRRRAQVVKLPQQTRRSHVELVLYGTQVEPRRYEIVGQAGNKNAVEIST